MEAGMYQRQLVMILKSRGSGSALQENLPSRWDMDFIITGCTYAEVAKYWYSGVNIALVLIELWTEEIDALPKWWTTLPGCGWGSRTRRIGLESVYLWEIRKFWSFMRLDALVSCLVGISSTSYILVLMDFQPCAEAVCNFLLWS